MSIKITGLDELQRNIRNLADKAKAIEGPHDIPISELLDPDFIARHTRFSNADQMFAASGFKTETPEEFAAIPDDQWDAFIRSATSFADWNEMLQAAGKEWVGKKIGL